MKNFREMTPSELELSRIELTAIIANTRASKKLKAVERELTRRKKDFWRPEVLRVVQRTDQHSGSCNTLPFYLNCNNKAIGKL